MASAGLPFARRWRGSSRKGWSSASRIAARVRAISEAEAVEIFEARAVLEGLVARYAAQQASEPTWPSCGRLARGGERVCRHERDDNSSNPN
jgi:DNA-binding GntR family transcriptional regulator